MNRKLISLGIAALAFAPCVTLSQDNAPTTPASDAAATGTVVFFREKKMMGAAISYKVRENGVEICKLKNGSFCTVQVPVGKHTYDVHSEAKDVLTLEVESGESYYVVGALSVGVFAGHPNLSPSTKEAFEALKAKLKDNTGKDLDPPEADKKKK